MSFFKKLFGGGDAEAHTEPEAETYEGFVITPTPIREGSAYRLSARIEKDIDGETRSHVLVRADTVGDLDQARMISVVKARQIIDEQGDRLLG